MIDSKAFLYYNFKDNAYFANYYVLSEVIQQVSSQIGIHYVRDFDLCDQNHFYIVKGISILAAVISYVCATYLGMPGLQFIQLIAAAVFLFCSGYGLSESFIRKGGLVHYWENKMIKVWLPSLMILVIAAFVSSGNFIDWIASSPMGLKGHMLYLIFGGYAVFWIVFQLVQNMTIRIIGIFVISAVACLCIPDSLAGKEAVFAFPVGVMASQLKWRRPIRQLTWKNRALLTAAVAAVSAGAWVLAVWMTIPALQTLLWALSYTAIGVLLVLGTYFSKAIPVFGIFVPFGIASYAIYLLYAEVLQLLKGQTDWRAFAIILLVLCVAAAILTVLREFLITWNHKLRRRKKPRLKGSLW